jgi:hypothetical protein
MLKPLVALTFLCLLSAFTDTYPARSECINYWINPSTGQRECFGSSATGFSSPSNKNIQDREITNKYDQPVQEQISTITDLFPLFTQAKQASLSINVKKSNFETEEQFKRRIEASQINIGTYQKFFDPDSYYSYKPETNTLSISLGEFASEWGGISTKYLRYINFKTIKKSSISSKVTCQNAFGATWNYVHIIEQRERYVLATNQENISSFEVKISPEQAKQYTTSDERNLNSRLKFLITFKPISPYYEKISDISGRSCPDSKLSKSLADLTGMTNSSIDSIHKLNIHILSIKLYDTSTHKILLETSFEH